MGDHRDDIAQPTDVINKKPHDAANAERRDDSHGSEDDENWSVDVAEPPLAPDGGWGWIVMMASFFISVLVDGICYTYGVLKPELENFFDTTSSTSAWGSSTC